MLLTTLGVGLGSSLAITPSEPQAASRPSARATDSAIAVFLMTPSKEMQLTAKGHCMLFCLFSAKKYSQ
jgi:hypothetical protein